MGNNIWIAFQFLVGYNLVLPIILFLGWLIFKKRTSRQGTGFREYDFAVIVTAYEQTTSLPSVINSLLKLNYSNYLIYVVADKCDLSTVKITNSRVIMLKPNEVLGSNTKSHNHAIENFKRDHEVLTIIDSDNLVDSDYLMELNKYFNKGFFAVQGLRAAKNLNTTYACLDAARDMYYHFYDGRILFDLGSSATLSGSGMAFTSALYRMFLSNNQVEGAGFDKVLQNYIVGQGFRIAFNEKAVVFDEKTTKSDQLVKQRARWINSWFKYFKLGFSLLGRGLLNFKWNQILFGLVLLRPPLFIFILLSTVCLLINLLVYPMHSLVWLVSLALFVLSFYISLLSSKPDKKIYKALKGIPNFMYLQLKSLMRSRNANRDSVATQHFH